jgi:dihydrofolate reductase/thymidylate synthase
VSFVRVRKSVAEVNDSNVSELTGNDTKNEKFEILNFSFLPKSIFEKHDEYQYLNLVQDIIRSGAWKSDRTGTGTLSKFGCQVLSPHHYFQYLYFYLIEIRKLVVILLLPDAV